MQQIIDITKTLLNTNEQIMKLKDNGILFNIVSEEEAIEYLTNNNYYFKLTSFRKNYKKYQSGDNTNRYINLEFAYLRDLAIIDMELRYQLAHLSLDIEHYTKLHLLNLAQENNEDGYQIVQDFLSGLEEEQRVRLDAEINRNKGSVYCGDLFDKHHDKFPIWAFLELIPFGRLIAFYRFCGNRYHNNIMIKNYFILRMCQDVRNATAHSCCVINDLKLNNTSYQTSFIVTRELAKIKGLSKNSRDKKMSNNRIQQIVSLLYMHKTLVTSDGVKEKASNKLKELVNRMYKNENFYITNEIVGSSFEFLRKVIDSWY